MTQHSMSLSLNTAACQQSLAQPALSNGQALGAALQDVSQTMSKTRAELDKALQERYAQYFTPMAIAQQMAAMLDLPEEGKIGDYGAGTGILGATVLGTSLSRHAQHGTPGIYTLDAYEIDEMLHGAFRETSDRIARLASDLWQPVPEVSLNGDFMKVAPTMMEGSFEPFLDAAILNPPYAKLPQSSELARLFRDHAAPTPNLYAAFVVLAVRMLRPGGQLVAIVPRSFCNGDYFKGFRAWMKSQGAIDWFVRYQRRSNAFRCDNVLQENVIFRFRKGAEQPGRIRISLCDDPESEPDLDMTIPTSDAMPEDDDRIYVPATSQELSALHRNRALPCTLEDLGLEIRTGKLEQFRFRSQLRKSVPRGERSWAPVVYAQHWRPGQYTVDWSSEVAGKPACLDVDERGHARLVEAGHYVVIKRISANDDRKGRCHPAHITPDCLPGDQWAFENHVQLIGPRKGQTLSPEMARGLTAFLATRDVDQVLKTVSGTTQINCNDIRRLRFPSAGTLKSMARTD